MIIQHSNGDYLSKYEPVARWKNHFRTGEWRVVDPEYIEDLISKKGSVQGQEKFARSVPTHAVTYCRKEDERNYVKMFIQLYEEYLEDLFNNSDTVGLELGCSTNASMYQFFHRLFSGEMILSDIHSSSVQSSCLLFPDKNVVGVTMSYHDILAPDETIDFVIEGNAYDMTMQTPKAMLEVARVLSNGGIFVGFQDVIPSELATLARGYCGEAMKAFYRNGTLENPIIIADKEGVHDCRAYHLRQVRKDGEAAGLITLYEGELTSVSVHPRTLHRQMLDALRIERQARDYRHFNDTYHTCAKYMRRADPDLPQGIDRYTTTANVLVMQKP